MNRKRLAEALAYVDEMRNRLLNQQPIMVPDEYGQRMGAAGEVAPSLRQVGQRTAQMGRQLTSLDQPRDADAGQMAVDIAAGFTPLQYPQAARDFERARRESDPLGMGLATLAAVPVVGGVAKAANVARKADVAAERAEALLAAQRNAAKPVSEGGLGLRPDSTPMERAAAMGFEPENPLYHGSVHDIKSVNLGKGDPGAFVGQGFYTTPSPEDASLNYASIYGPDTFSKIERGMENTDKDLRRIAGALSKGKLSPARAEVLLRETGTGENLGAVYPLLVRRGKEANMVERGKSAFIAPGEQYDEAADEFLPTENASAWQDAFQVFQDYGVDPPDELYSLMQEGGTLDDIWEAVANSRGLQAYDPDTGTPLTSGGLASEVVKALGANTVTHPTEFRNQALNIAGQHTIALQPTGIVRSKFAAFDPAKLTSPDLLAGVAGPTVLAAALMEQERRKKERKEKGL
jgi:hypothetical protein